MFVIFAAACFCWLLIAVLIPQLRRHVTDIPNHRSSHLYLTPRGGGLGFVLVSSMASVFALLALSNFSPVHLPLVAAPLLALPLALVGLLDDLYNLPASWRFFAQLSTSLLVISASPLVFRTFGIPLILGLLFAVTAVINFTNFMDGLDGLVAGCMAVSISVAAIQLSVPLPIWALVGALLGFLFWNWSPASVFMGDVGSTFLGAVFSLLVLQAPTWIEALGLLLVATPFLADALFCVPRRLMAGQRVFQAHRLHLFQRLHQSGWPHDRVSSLYILATAVLGIALICGGLLWVIIFAVFELLIGVWLDRHVAIPFAVASRI